jgi:protein-tyrosine phosphatase
MLAENDVPAGPVDIHVHILPGVDDGAPDLEAAIRMAEVAAQDGIAGLVATPHGTEWRRVGNREEFLARLDQVKAAVRAAGISVNIYPGQEAWLGPNLLDQLADGYAFTLNDSRYILVEVPFSHCPGETEELTFQLLAHGYVPIMAHPERNADLARDLDRVCRLIEMGMRFQITAGSLLGHFGPGPKAAAERYVRHRLAHFLASDAHQPTGHRVPQLSQARRLIGTLAGPDYADLLTVINPAAAVADAELVVPEPERPHQKTFWETIGWRR